MTEQPITYFLADRLAELDDEALDALAKVAGVSLRTARRAATGEPIKAWAALCLIAARGYDPITREQIVRRKLGRFNPQTLALFLNQHMRVHHLTVRKAAEAMKVSTRVVDAICDVRDVSISNVVKACVYLDIHPFAQCEQVKREAA